MSSSKKHTRRRRHAQATRPKRKQSAKRAAAALFTKCRELAESPDILELFAADLERAGVVGEARGSKLLLLALTSRLFDRPVSVVVKGPSSAGKSVLVDAALKFFPSSAYYALTAMSERALAHGKEPLKHRFIVIFEAAGLPKEIGDYLIRSLLSENRILYETVEKGNDGKYRSRRIEREGPTGLILTTTAARLHHENETRLLTLTVNDTRAQTRRIMLAQARQDGAAINGPPVSFTRWHALHQWLEGGELRVVIPYAERLAKLIPPVAVRLRRDFPAVGSLIKAHALLHRATRLRDAEGRIIATLADYAAVRSLVADLIAEGADAIVSPTLRETVEAVVKLNKPEGVSVTAIAEVLGIDKGPASRRVHVGLTKGYLFNEEERKGRPARWVVGEPLPTEVVILPPADKLMDGSAGSDFEEFLHMKVEDLPDE